MIFFNADNYAVVKAILFYQGFMKLEEIPLFYLVIKLMAKAFSFTRGMYKMKN